MNAKFFFLSIRLFSKQTKNQLLVTQNMPMQYTANLHDYKNDNFEVKNHTNSPGSYPKHMPEAHARSTSLTRFKRVPRTHAPQQKREKMNTPVHSTFTV